MFGIINTRVWLSIAVVMLASDLLGVLALCQSECGDIKAKKRLVAKASVGHHHMNGPHG